MVGAVVCGPYERWRAWSVGSLGRGWGGLRGHLSVVGRSVGSLEHDGIGRWGHLAVVGWSAGSLERGGAVRGVA